jgi:hypothetical protein
MGGRATPDKNIYFQNKVDKIKMKDNVLLKIKKYFALAMALFPAGYIIYRLLCQTAARMKEEIGFAYTADAPMYWTVGKGMLQGFRPYVDLYETKPPGIFLLSALSFKLTDTAVLTNIICFICLLITGAAPFIGVAMNCKKSLTGLTKIILFISAFVFGVMIMLYSQLRSGAAQVENIGAGFAIIYILIISTIDSEKIKLNSPKIWLSSLFLMFAVMMKEPFLLICIASSLFFIKTKKDFLKKLLLPMFAGGIAGVILMLVTGALAPYLKYYLPNMMGGHVSRFGPPWIRGLDLKIILEDLAEFSPGLMIAVIVLVVFVFLSDFFFKVVDNENKISDNILSGIKFYLSSYLLVFSVGLGGQYYSHHFVFAVPLYITLFLHIVENYKGIKLNNMKDLIGVDGILVSIGIACSIGIAVLPDYGYEYYFATRKLEVMKDNAEYVDDVLDRVGEDTYQFLGFNGDVFYCFTEHLPQGPIFFQDPFSFTDTDNWFSKSLANQLDKVDIIIIDWLDVGEMNEYVEDYISDNFTEQPPEEVRDIAIPKSFIYDVMYRV